MPNDDRVADLYYRRIFNGEAQEACRDRVHWLCEHIVGQRVLDVGCSQGITSIILAREGRSVVGLDIETNAIEAARRAAAEESRQVQERLRFHVFDAYSAEFEPGSFDTVILGELLEHLTSPAQLIERVRAWLRLGGRVVVSVPHGLSVFSDHKRTFYLHRLLSLLARSFEVTDVQTIRGRFLCAVAVRVADEDLPEHPDPDKLAQWTAVCEADLEAIQRDAYRARTDLEKARDRLNTTIEELQQNIARLEADTDELRGQLETASQEQASLRQKAQAAAQRESEVTERIKELQRSLVDQRKLETALQLAREKAERLESVVQREKQRREGIEQRGQSLQNKEQASKEETHRTKTQMEAEKQRRRQAESRVERLQSQLDYYKSELTLREQEVRYRLGDALVRAARPSIDTLKLPVRLMRLLTTGLGRQRTRRREAKQRKQDSTASTSSEGPGGRSSARETRRASLDVTVLKGTPGSKGNGQAASALTPTMPTSPTLDAIATLAQPFSSAPPGLRRRNDLSIAAVTDEFSWRAWQFEADLRTFTPTTWKEALTEQKPNCLFVESTWSGIGDSWYFQLRDLGKRGEVIKHYAIPEMVAWCRKRGIPTVFYNKEDPPNFDVFIDAAKQFDFVFTSDANCIPDYRKHVGHDRVYALPFGAQPRIHNPIMTGTRTGSVCFAGTWYAHRHFGRHEDAERILRPGLDFDLHIFDRMAKSGNPNYSWPEIYLPAVRGALPYAQMLAAYKRYKVFLNINSVKNSPTMFSRRVFELLACGTPVISSYSEGVEELIGSDIVLMSEEEATTRKLLERVLGDEEYRERLSLRGQRKVFCEHTYTHRMQTLLDLLGLDCSSISRPTMTMIAVVENTDQAAAAWNTFSRQTYENKNLVLCTADPDAVANVESLTGGAKAVRVVASRDTLCGHLLEEAVRGSEDGFIAALNPSHHYGRHYLTDYANATLYVTEPAIGKANFYETKDPGAAPRVIRNGSEYRISTRVNPWTLCLSRNEALPSIATLRHAQSALEWWNRTVRGLDRIYAADRFNYVQQGNSTATAQEPAVPASKFAGSEARALETALV